MGKMKFIDVKISHHRFLLWVIAVVITVASAYYQRRTGPTYDYRGKVTLQENTIGFKLSRVGIVGRDASLRLTIPDTTVMGFVRFKRYKSTDDWTEISMTREGDKLSTSIPQQPAAGKIMYFVSLAKDLEKISLTGENPVILRYRGDVPMLVLLLHIVVIFAAMLLSNRTAFEALDSRGKSYKYMLWTIGALIVGGFILGPIMQKFAFGVYWTGFPLGTDLTDNKTLITLIGWLVALFLNRGGRDRRGWIVFAAVLLLVAYLIPHSLLGSELDYSATSSLP